MPKSSNGAAVVDVFCGIGGLTHGFYKEGFDIVAGIDDDPTCKYAFEKNNESNFIKESIENITSDDIRGLFKGAKVKILIGCAPCQPFSTYNKKKKENDEWRLLRNFCELVKAAEPHVVSMENVPQLRHHVVFAEFVQALKDMKYEVWYDVVYCPDYGVAQRRRRLVLLASKFGELELMPPTHSLDSYRTVWDEIGNLRPIKAGSTDPKDPLHRARDLQPLNMKRIRATPEGGGWESWDRSLLLKCHKKKKGKSFRAVYGRMRRNQPGSTITTLFHNIGCGRFGHPKQHRAISIREAALLQSFPKYYKFVEHKSEIKFDVQARHIGNAVPVRLGRAIARSIKQHIEDHVGGVAFEAG